MVHHGAALRKIRKDRDFSIFHAWAEGREEPFDEKERHLMQVARELTSSPPGLMESTFQLLREDGWDERAISQIVQIIAYFNYINRVMIGLAVPVEPEYEEEFNLIKQYVPDIR